MTDAFAIAAAAIVDDAPAALEILLQAKPGLVGQTVVDEAFVAALIHQFYQGDTLLHVAAAGFRAQIAEILLAHGADVHARNRRGATALHYAADTNHDNEEAQGEVISALVRAGAAVDAIDKSGATPLHRAVRTRGAEAVRRLLSCGANANSKNRNGSTPLDLARLTTGRSGSGTPQAKAAQAEIIRLLTV